MGWEMGWDAMSAIATAAAAFVFIVTAIIAVVQLREMKRGTIAQAFSAIVSLLHSEKCRKARKVLMNIEEKDFAKWTEDQVDDAEIACSTYDIVGILLRRKVIDHRMVTAEWGQSIVKCWEHAEPMITRYRKGRGQDYWDDFEDLYNKARDLKDQRGKRRERNEPTSKDNPPRTPRRP